MSGEDSRKHELKYKYVTKKKGISPIQVQSIRNSGCVGG